jgi:hypothetical protein
MLLESTADLINSAILSDGESSEESEEVEYDRPSTSKTKYPTSIGIPYSFLTSTTTRRSTVSLPNCSVK